MTIHLWQLRGDALARRLQKLALVAALALPMHQALAHGGEDHSHDDKKTPAAAAPVADGGKGDSRRARRLADGSVAMPKLVQRQAGLLTQAAEAGSFPKTVELAGRVIGDPAASGQVQATQAGRIEGGSGGLAMVGQRVRAGQVLGWLRPVASSMERGALQAQVADLAAQLAVAERKYERARQLEGLTPQKELEATRIEVDGVKARLAALRGGLDATEALTAPVGGVIGASRVVAGQVVEARELLFDIVDPQRLAIEALAYDAALVERATGGRLLVAGDREGARLRFVGGARQLREGALPLLFRVEAKRGAPALAVGQSVSVLVETREKLDGVVLPASAVSRDGQGQTRVWVKLAPEHFAPRQITPLPLDATRVVVAGSLKAGERIVVQGAPALGLVK